jgi:hypothetical protein
MKYRTKTPERMPGKLTLNETALWSYALRRQTALNEL